MRNLIQRCKNRLDRVEDVRPAAVLLSWITLVIAISAKEPLNSDGILYLQTAEIFAKYGLRAAMELYPWPFYSVMIALLGKMLHLPFEYAAYILNAALLAIIVGAFLTLLRECGASRAIQIFGAFIIIGHPRLHHYQSYIIRGFGYWGFSLLSLLYLIRYYRNLNWRHALFLGVCLSIAPLFRIEGVVLCAFAPLVLLFRSNTGLWARLGHTLKPYIFPLAVLSIVQVYWLSYSDQSIANFGRIRELIYQAKNGFMLFGTNLNEKAALISNIIFDRSSSKWGFTMIISGLLAVCLYRLITTVGVFHTLLCGHGVYANVIPSHDGSKKVLWYFTLLTLAIPVFHMGQTFFPSHRFFMLGSLILLLWTPFSLDQLFKQWRRSVERSIRPLFLFILSLLILTTMFIFAFIPAGGSRAYVIAAGKWLKQNMSPESRLYSNTRQIPFYAGREFIYWKVSGPPPAKKNRWETNDIIALRLGKKHYKRSLKVLKKLKELEVIKVFSNKKGDKVIVYQVSDYED